MSKVSPDKKWEKELKSLIDTQVKDLTSLIDKKEKKIKEEMDIINSIQDVVIARLETVKKMITPDKKLGPKSDPTIDIRPHKPPEEKSEQGTGFINKPIIKPDGYPREYEIEMVMPALNDVTEVNLLFRTIIRSQKIRNQDDPKLTLFLRAYHKYPESQLDQKGFLEMPYKKADTKTVDDFVKVRVLNFVKSWYTRRIAFEVDKEREYKMIIHVK